MNVVKIGMPTGAPNIDQDRIMLDLLESVDREGTKSQRVLATELGIALGLVNAYLKRCVAKGLLKVQQVPSRRYAYYLTPIGFAEKSRLTASYLTHSFSFFRRARLACEATLQLAIQKDMRRLVLVGASELAEIMTLCAREYSVTLIGIVDSDDERKTLAGCKIYEDFSPVGRFDGVLITNIETPDAAYDAAVAAVGAHCVLVPDILKLHRSVAPTSLPAENAS